MCKRIFARICVSERIYITLLLRVQLCFRIILCGLFAVASFDQAQAAASAVGRNYHYSQLKISRASTREAMYKLKGAGGREILVSAMPDIVKHMRSVMNEQKTDGLEIELEGFADRPEDAKALLFSLRNATTTGAIPFMLVESDKQPGVDKPNAVWHPPKLESRSNEDFAKTRQLAMHEPINSFYIIRKTGSITREERPYSSKFPYSYVQHAVIDKFDDKGQIDITFRSPAFFQLFALVDRFVAILNAVYLDIFADIIGQNNYVNPRVQAPALFNTIPTSRNHEDAVRIAKKRLASELGMSDDELDNVIQVEIENMQITFLDWTRIAGLME